MNLNDKYREEEEEGKVFLQVALLLPTYRTGRRPFFFLWNQLSFIANPPGGRAKKSRGFIRLLPSRVGFAERDASRPAFGGSSLVSLTRHTCVGGGPIGGALCVRPCVLSCLV